MSREIEVVTEIRPSYAIEQRMVYTLKPAVSVQGKRPSIHVYVGVLHMDASTCEREKL